MNDIISHFGITIECVEVEISTALRCDYSFMISLQVGFSFPYLFLIFFIEEKYKQLITRPQPIIFCF